MPLCVSAASGNPIQPAPAPVFKHPAPAQAGPVASLCGWYGLHIWLGNWGCTGQEGEHMGGPVGASQPQVPSLSLILPFQSWVHPEHPHSVPATLLTTWVWILPWAHLHWSGGYRCGPRFRTRVPVILHRGPYFPVRGPPQSPTLKEGLGVHQMKWSWRKGVHTEGEGNRGMARILPPAPSPVCQAWLCRLHVHCGGGGCPLPVIRSVTCSLIQQIFMQLMVCARCWEYRREQNSLPCGADILTAKTTSKQ